MAASPNRVLAIVVAAVAILAVVAAVVAANRADPQPDLATPEGVVQAYLLAAVDGDTEAAAAFLSPVSGCNAADLADAYIPDGVRVVLVSTNGDDPATVTVEIIESGGPGVLGGYEYSYEDRFTLESDGGSWLITRAPWPAIFCRDG